jgi:putative membrane protein
MEGAAEEKTNRAVFSHEPEIPTLQTEGEITSLSGENKKVYEDLEKKLILRDKLAIERTKLSKERTALSYIRTGFSMILGGMFFVGYFQEGTFFSYVGIATVFVAIIFTIFGFMQNQRSMKVINTVMGELNGRTQILNKEEQVEES